MKRLILLTAVSVLSFSNASFAGFEWMPPAQNPAPIAAAPVLAPSMNNKAHSGFPAAPVMREPLETPSMGYGQPTSILPPVAAQAPVKNLSSSGRGLYIDPYPLRSGVASTMDIAPESVQQAMVEEARILNPLPLGAGLSTGTQPRISKQPSAQADYGLEQAGYGSGNVPRAPLNSGMTPMMGGEPAPLMGVSIPRTPMASRAQNPAQMQYAQAVGFGRDLPLALALSQIIPSEFRHRFAAGVDAGTTVSWEGGKSWDQALQDMLRPAGMTAIINGNQVTIQPLARG